jgi:multiple sugar transport system permease protein
MSQFPCRSRVSAGLPSGRRHRLEFLPYALIAPILLLLLAISVYPTIYAIWLAMTDASLLRLARAKFIGLDNLWRMIGDTTFINGLWRTLRWDLSVVLTQLALALPIALLLNPPFRARGVVRAAMMVPYITPPAVVALMFSYIVDGNFGVLNDILVKLGVLTQYFAWLSDPTASFLIVVSAMVWYGTPLMALILLAVRQTIPSEEYEAAKVDGASAHRMFWHITLPHLMPTILFLLLFRVIWMSNHIDMIYIITLGGPGFSNYTEAIYSFNLTTQFEIGYASAVAVALTLILVTGSALYVRHLARSVLASS